MRTIHLVTHPEAQHHVDGLVGGWYDSELTPDGLDDADRIAGALVATIGLQESPVEVYSSDLRRTRITAERIAARFSTDVHLDHRLRERHQGEAEGRPQEWLNNNHIPLPERGDRLHHHDGPAGSETRWQLLERLYPALDDIINSPAINQIIVSHGSASSYLIAAWIGMPMASSDRVFFPLASGSITTLVRNDTHHSHAVTRLNDTSHLRRASTSD